jgi:SAM-dependent methyltransferase
MYQIYHDTYNYLYDSFFGDIQFPLSTPNLLYTILDKCEPQTKILDFGCGNGVYYSKEKIINKIKNDNLQILGIDINYSYVVKCKNRIYENNLESNVNIELMNIFDCKIDDEHLKFDYIIFTESAPIINDILLIEIIKHMKDHILKSNGKIIFINNLIDDNDINQQNVTKYKPYLKYFLGVDFGRTLKKSNFINIIQTINFDYNKIAFEEPIFNVIDEMMISKIFSYFDVGFIIHISKYIFGIKDYSVKQYAITLCQTPKTQH